MCKTWALRKFRELGRLRLMRSLNKLKLGKSKIGKFVLKLVLLTSSIFIQSYIYISISTTCYMYIIQCMNLHSEEWVSATGRGQGIVSNNTSQSLKWFFIRIHLQFIWPIENISIYFRSEKTIKITCIGRLMIPFRRVTDEKKRSFPSGVPSVENKAF
jgi:hypothetical protein